MQTSIADRQSDEKFKNTYSRTQHKTYSVIKLKLLIRFLKFS